MRVLVVTAHPDDIDFGMGGTIAHEVEGGAEVRYVLVTSGQRGGPDATADPAAYGHVREAEQRAAAAVLGVTDVRFLGFDDGSLSPWDRALRVAVAREYRAFRPDRLMTTHPDQLLTGGFVNHPDHRAVGTVALDCALAYGTTGMVFPELAIDEGHAAWQGCREVWMSGFGVGDHVVDITATLERKLTALRLHVSQLADPDATMTFMRERMAALGEPHGFPYAESFAVVRRR